MLGVCKGDAPIRGGNPHIWDARPFRACCRVEGLSVLFFWGSGVLGIRVAPRIWHYTCLHRLEEDPCLGSFFKDLRVS